MSFLFWWELVDSNHRSIKQQIYSLSPLATRESSHILLVAPAWSHLRVLDYYSKPTEEMQEVLQKKFVDAASAGKKLLPVLPFDAHMRAARLVA